MKDIDTDKTAKTIGRNITNLLIEYDKTQQELADVLGVSKSTVSTWVNGKRIPRMDKIDRMCKFFGVQRSAILADTSLADHYLNKAFQDTVNAYPHAPMAGMSDDEFKRRVWKIMDERQYYEDETVQMVTERLRTNPEYSVMFKAASNVKPEDLEFVTKFIEKFSD